MTNMSDAPTFEPGGRLPFAALAGASGFRSDARFAPLGEAPPASEGPPAPQPEPEDPFTVAYAEGYAAGTAEAQARAAARAK